MHLKLMVTLLLCIFMHEHVPVRGDIFDDLIKILSKKIGVADDTTTTTAATTTTASVEEDPVVEPYADPDDGVELLRQARLLRTLERVEKKFKIIKSHIAQEAAVDVVLQGLDNKLSHDFKMVKDVVVQKTQAAKKDSIRRADKVKSTLSTVESYARSRNKDVAGAIYHGGIGSVCSTGSDECRLPDSECQGGVCQCEPGLSYDALKIRCVDTCRHYGDTYQTTPNYVVRGYNTQVINETSIEECKAKCQKADTFTCRAIEYFPRWRECYLSDVVKTKAMDEAWEYNSGGSHYQRDCAYF